MVKKHTTILTIAGSDNTSGAGIQADIKTSYILGAYCLSAVTTVTSQNSKKFARLHNIPNHILKAQLKASFEEYKMWYEEDFIKLAELLFEKKLFDYIYLICGPDKTHISRKIINDSNKKYFIDCSSKDLQGVILAIKSSDFYVGNNSGPLNMSAALGIKTFGLIANDPVSELKFSKINPITPKDYTDNVWNRDRSGMKKLKPNEVFEKIIEKL